MFGNRRRGKIFRISRTCETDSGTPQHKVARRREDATQKALRAAQTDPGTEFGIMKSARGYRQCPLGGLENVKGEW
jgi:hypothetical protein